MVSLRDKSSEVNALLVFKAFANSSAPLSPAILTRQIRS